MPTPKEPAAQQAEDGRDQSEADTMSLVDLFDRMDREAFRRALAENDRCDRAVSGT